MTATPETRSIRGRAAAIVRRVRDDEAGWALIEVIVAAGMMIVVLSAALLTFNLLVSNQSTASARFDSQDRARTALDLLSRDLRNVAGASTGATEIDQAGAYDLIFRTVNRVGPQGAQNATNLERVRYCIDNSTPAAETLWFQVQTIVNSAATSFTPPTGCPDNGWATGGTMKYADAITNENNGATRPVFSYTTSNGAIIAVHADLFVNAKPSGAAAETHLSTGVFLRNQDVPPTAAFTATAGSGYITLDGSGSSDPQGSPLTYVWYDGAVKVGTGIVFTYTSTANPNPPPATVPLAHGSQHTITLKVYDPAGLEADAAAQTVAVQ